MTPLMFTVDITPTCFESGGTIEILIDGQEVDSTSNAFGVVAS